MIKKIFDKLEDFIYKKIIRNIVFISRIGRRSMFGYADTGLNFDYIYRNQAKGYTRLGKTVDKILLNLPAAKATRFRKDKIVGILREEVNKNKNQGVKTRIVDIASGPARYIVELITEDIENYVEALCLDIDRLSLIYGKKIAGKKPILYKKSNVLRISPHHKRFSQKKNWRPNVIVASGFYEYLDDKTAISSLKTIKDFLETNGLLLLITQRDNPNRKLIEKLGVTKSGKRWILFYREPPVIEKWLRDIGYRHIEIEVDPWRMYVFYKGRKSYL